MQHLAMIMDGNRRWARENKLKSVSLGHKKGAEAIKVAVNFCLKKSIKHLSLYTFSIENFRRSIEEKTYLFGLLVDGLKDNLPSFIKEGIRVRFVGNRELFPKSVMGSIEEVESTTKDFNNLTLNFLFCYGSQQEMAHAAKNIAKKVRDGVLDVDSIDESLIKKESWLGDIPDPDLFVRTGGVLRISNFMLFQMAYSEMIFLDCYWPEITEEKLQECFDKFNSVKRNFGK